VAAEVVDDTGIRHTAAAANGAWVIVLDQTVRGEDPLVRFADAGGNTIARPLPVDWPRSPVADAPEPCPACGASGWDEVLPLGDSRGGRMDEGGNVEPLPIVVCRACGHEEPVGLVVSAEIDSDDEQVPAAALEDIPLPDEWEAEQRAALRDLDMPVYVVQGWAARVDGWGGGEGKTTMVSVQQGEVCVETDWEDYEPESERVRAQQALEPLLHDAESAPSRSEAGLTIWLAVAERERRRVAATASIETVTLEMDGEPRDFQMARAGSRWAAVRRQGELVVTVTGDGIAPAEIALVTVADPASLID
jgi:hypothetical protein